MTTVRLQWADMGLSLTAHTVKVRGGFVAGYLARDHASRADLGYVWASGTSWHWRTPNEQHYGERSSQSAALQTLRDITNLDGARRMRPVLVDFDGPPTRTNYQIPVRATRVRAVAPKPAPQPPAPAEPLRPNIVWDDDASAIDLTTSVAAALEGHRR